MKRGRVYCKGCKWFESIECDMGGVWVCHHPKNLIPVRSSVASYRVPGNTMDCNSKNNCTLRVQKPWWMIWRG